MVLVVLVLVHISVVLQSPHRRGSHLVFVFGFLQVRFYLLPHIAIGPFRLKVRTAEYPAKQFVMMLNM